MNHLDPAVLLQYIQIRGFHGGHYEECRLLGYKNPGRTSQETQVCLHYTAPPNNPM
jgi:hypothetical protein